MHIRTDIRNSLHYEVRDASPEEIRQLIDAATKLGLVAVPAAEFDDDAPQMTVIADTEESADLFRRRFPDAFLG
jgi:hypothetical protein